MSKMIRVGFVNARQPEKMRVKVTVRDTTGAQLVTDWLPVLCPRASGDMQYDLPDIDDQVLCLFLPYGLEQGFVVGAMYGKQTPPVQSGDKWHRTFSDGTADPKQQQGFRILPLDFVKLFHHRRLRSPRA